jgi:DNA-binding transcriptional ArsR family regulator
MSKQDTEKLAAFLKAKMKGKGLAELPAVFKMLSELTRLRLLNLLLTQGKQSVNELCEKLRLRQPAASHHLGLLRMHGLVANVRSGKNVFYSAAE